VRWAALLVAAALAAGCGAQSGLHMENGGRTVAVVPDSTTQPTSSGGSPLPREVTARVALGGTAAIAWDGDTTIWAAVWAGGPHLLGSLVAVDTRTGRPAAALPLPPSQRAYLLAVDHGALYVAATDRVLQIDPHGGAILRSLRMGSPVRALLDSRGSLWATLDAGPLLRLDPATLAVRASWQVTGSPDAVTTSPGSVFVTDDRERTLSRVSMRTGKVTATVSIGAAGAGPPSQITVYADSIWVYEGASVLRLLLNGTQLVDRIGVPGAGGSIAAGTGGVWVSGSFGVARIDPATGALGTSLAVGQAGAAIATTGNAVWVVQRPTGTLLRLVP
jgi:DNA-binding beta-propeller fold protein YncE